MTFMTDNEPKRPVLPFPPATAGMRIEKTSQTDDERIKDITVLPPPEHSYAFFPIRGTAVESLITRTPERPQHHPGQRRPPAGDRPAPSMTPRLHWSTPARWSSAE
jgi:hypothetical protein